MRGQAKQTKRDVLHLRVKPWSWQWQGSRVVVAMEATTIFCCFLRGGSCRVQQGGVWLEGRSVVVRFLIWMSKWDIEQIRCLPPRHSLPLWFPWGGMIFWNSGNSQEYWEFVLGWWNGGIDFMSSSRHSIDVIMVISHRPNNALHLRHSEPILFWSIFFQVDKKQCMLNFLSVFVLGCTMSYDNMFIKHSKILNCFCPGYKQRKM